MEYVELNAAETPRAMLAMQERERVHVSGSACPQSNAASLLVNPNPLNRGQYLCVLCNVDWGVNLMNPRLYLSVQTAVD